MPPPWATVGVFAVGVILGFVGFVYKKYRKRHSYENNHRGRRPSLESSQRGRNLSCPFCGLRLSGNPHEMQCGHQFHRNCYADRLLESGDGDGIHHLPCPICGEANNRLSNGASAIEGLSDRRDKCSYCSRILRSNEGDRVQLNCGHFAHSICRVHCEEIQQCSNCSVDRIKNSKCSLCEIPIQSSDKNLERLECGHIIHQSCASIAKFIVCANCPQMEGAPLD